MPDHLSLHLPAEAVEALLTARGWTLERVPGGTTYVRPGRPSRAAGGRCGADYLWGADEALTDALTNEAAGVVQQQELFGSARLAREQETPAFAEQFERVATALHSAGWAPALRQSVEA